MSGRRRAGLVLAVVALALAGGVLETVADAGAFRTVTPHGFEACTRIEGFTGSEDAVFDEATGLVLFSSQDFRSLEAEAPRDGAIFGWDPGSSASPRPIAHDLGSPLHPHGLGLFVAADGTRILFVVTHPTRTSSQVESFEVMAGPSLKHRRTFTAPEFISLNDVAPVGPEQFYVTIDAGTRAGTLARLAETFLRLPWSGLGYFDGTKAQVVASGMRYANGVAVSGDGTTVFVSESTGRRLMAFSRDVASGHLTLIVEQRTESGLDNLSMASDGAIWVAAHPKLLDFLGHAKDPNHHSPSQLLRARLDLTSVRFLIDEVAIDDGSTISGSSVALPLPSGRVVVGSVFERHALSCAVTPGVR